MQNVMNLFKKEDQMQALTMYNTKKKSTGVFYALMLLPAMFGFCGVNYFYMASNNDTDAGKNVMWGIIYLCTFGLLGFGVLFDLFTGSGYVKGYNEKVVMDLRKSFYGE